MISYVINFRGEGYWNGLPISVAVLPRTQAEALRFADPESAALAVQNCLGGVGIIEPYTTEP